MSTSPRVQRFTASPRRKISLIFSCRRRSKHGQPAVIADIRFPLEIWEPIIDFLSDTETQFYPLLTVHSAFHRAVERVLYRHINLSGDHLHHAARRIGLFERLADDPQIARLVQSFILTPLITHTKTNRFDDAKKYYSMLHRALCSLTNLRSLTLIKLPISRAWVNVGTPWGLDGLFHGCNFQLRHLSLGSFYTQGASTIEGRQHLVEELAVHHELDQTFSTTAFPNLRVLEVISQTKDIPRLLSDGERPIEALYWTSWRPLFEGGPFLNIKALRLAVVDGLNMSKLAEVFPHLRYLRIDFYKDSLDQNAESFEGLSQLHYLRKVVFGGVAPLAWRSFALRRNITDRLFSAIPLLESVSLGLESWGRESGDKVVFASNPHEWKDRSRWQ